MSEATGGKVIAMEYAPSGTRAETPILARYVGGFLGLFFFTLGVASIIGDKFFKLGPLGEGWGALAAAAGTALLLYHALRDNDLEVRRVYGMFGTLLLLVAVGVGVFPAKPDGATDPVAGELLMPWGAIIGFVGLLFLVQFARHETEEPYCSWVRIGLAGTGGLLLVGAFGIGVFVPDLLAGPGFVLGLLGLAYLIGYFMISDTSDGPPYKVALGLGILGGAALTYMLFRSIGPDVLFRGASALKKANQSYDIWKVAGRAIVILGGLSGLLALLAKSWPKWLKFGVAGIGVAFALLMIAGSFANPIASEPKPYLIPGGMLLGALGFAASALSLGIVSDSPLVVLTRRELAGFFFSPIAYIVLLGNALIAGIAYYLFLDTLGFTDVVDGGRRPASFGEPILRYNFAFTVGAAFTVPFLVAAITMRLFAEEKRSGTYEVLLTAPVRESSIVLSKFIATLGFYSLCWIPAGIYLVALRYVGGSSFDFRPIFTYGLAMTACGASFVALGLFISSLTKNQIIAALITFAGLLGMLFTYFLRPQDTTAPPAWKSLILQFDFLSLWFNSLMGSMPISPVVFHASLAAFWLFLTTKVLEIRKWG